METSSNPAPACCDRGPAACCEAAAGGDVPRVGTELTFRDRLGSAAARWGIGRMRYVVAPGLYRVGEPGADAPVLVTANYKMSFDRLRRELGGLDAWILVLDTKGINVWCAAGKGTFGTDELVRRIEAVHLAERVSHRTLILPQLGAVGVAAHEVKARSGFRVVYGPVRAADLPAFLAAGMKATAEMRRVRFGFRDRVVLIPIELVMSAKWVLLAAAAILVLAGFGGGGYSLGRAVGLGLGNVAILAAGWLWGAAAPPALLAWLPGRAFAAKGAVAGVVPVLALAAWWGLAPPGAGGAFQLAAWMLGLAAAASCLAMNFTGASTYTSLSGVQREMRVAIPLQLAATAVAAGLWVAGLFL